MLTRNTKGYTPNITLKVSEVLGEALAELAAMSDDFLASDHPGGDFARFVGESPVHRPGRSCRGWLTGPGGMYPWWRGHSRGCGECCPVP